MNSTIIEVHPRKPEFDPLGAHVRAELIEAGEPPKESSVQTQRLYKIEGDFDAKAIESIAHTLLVDPIVETVILEEIPTATKKSKKTPAKKPANAGWVVDVWPKPGVTDPVGETVQKGLRDLGYNGSIRTSSAIRYVFPKIKNSRTVEVLARRVLANELIHDIHIRKI